MKINENEIARAARRMRNEENKSLRVKKWQYRKMLIPSWLIYIPAAAMAGFIFGLWTGEQQQSAENMAIAKADTVYVKQIERVVEYDTIYKEQQTATINGRVRNNLKVGVPVTQDNLPYHLLVMQ